MIQKSTFELVRKKYKQAQTEKFKEAEKERKQLSVPDDDDDVEPPPPPEKSNKQFNKQRKLFNSEII
jgi:hypothetical protein